MSLSAVCNGSKTNKQKTLQFVVTYTTTDTEEETVRLDQVKSPYEQEIYHRLLRHVRRVTASKQSKEEESEHSEGHLIWSFNVCSAVPK